MTGADWGELTAIFVGNFLGFVICTWLAALLLVGTTRLTAAKVLLAALVVGHFAANLVRFVGGSDTRWSALGYTVSRLIGLPLMWWLIHRRVPRWIEWRESTRSFPVTASQRPVEPTSERPPRDWEAERKARREELERDPARYVPYGPDLAAVVADHLLAGGVIANYHKEYCGMGLCYAAGRFIYDEVHDGTFRSLWSTPPELDLAAATFPDRPAFLAWLAAQSDDSLSGRDRHGEWYLDNQRITRARLLEAVRQIS